MQLLYRWARREVRIVSLTNEASHSPSIYRVKIWSLRTGAAIVSPPSSSDSLFTNVFQEPVTVLKFTGSDRMSNERRDDGTARGRRELESKEGWKEGTGPKLYVGDGFEVLSYRTQGMEAS